MADETGLLEAAPVEVAEPVEAVQTDVDTSAAVDTDTQAADTSTDGADLRGPQLWRDTKTKLEESGKFTKAEISAIRRAIHYEHGQSTKYPEGIAPLEAAQKAIQSLVDDPTAPIERVIEETLQERNYFRELDELFTQGKPDFVEKMAEASPESFQQLAPAVFRKFSELNPEGYSAYVSQAVVSHFNSAEVPLQFSILKAFLPQLPESPAKDQIVQAVNAIYGSFDTLKQLSTKPVTKPFNAPAQQQTQTPNGPDAGMDLTRREWNLSVQREGVDMVLNEAKRLAGKTQLSDKEQKEVLSRVGEELDARLMAKKDYATTMQGYLKNGNRSAYIQRIQSERKQMIPSATRRAVDDVIAARPKAQPKTAADPAKTVAKPGQNQHTVAFRRIAGHPKTQGMTVDLNRTPQSMLLKRQAYVKGEDKPVQW